MRIEERERTTAKVRAGRHQKMVPSPNPS
jgi:hypothetical protein